MEKELENIDLKIEERIFEIRGKQVMLDSDLAKLYGCANGTKDLNKSVKRNIERFPEEFCFKITREEYYEILRFQFGTLELNQGKYSKYLPYVFTEQGVAMLASVLHSNIAVNVSIQIIKAFISMRKYIGNNEFRLHNIETKLIEHDNNIKLLQDSFNKLEEKRKVNEIYFNGQIYDAYSKIIDILKEAKENLVIIDGYADKTVLDIISKLNVKVRIICKKKSLLTKIDIEKYNAQYNNLEIIYDDTFHDRYFILDNQVVYHCGTSLNRIGYKTFSINLISDSEICRLIIDKIKEI